MFNFLEESDYPIIQRYMFNYDYEKGAHVFKEGAHRGYMFFIVDGAPGSAIARAKSTLKLTVLKRENFNNLNDE